MFNFWSTRPLAAHQAAETLFRTTQQLMDAISRSAIPADECEYAQFRNDMQAMSERMSLDQPDETLVTVGSAARALEEYNARVGRAYRQYQVELRGIVMMLAETVNQCTAASDRSKDKLLAIEHRLEKAQAIEDIRLLKLQLSECLESLRAESEEQRKIWNEQIQTLSSGLASARKSLPSAESQTSTSEVSQTLEDIDPSTGLPSRRAALEALAERIRTPENQYAVIFVVDRAETANLRFGHAVGDQMIEMWQQLLLSWFGDPAQIFRWSAPSLLLLLERDLPLARFRAEITRMCSARQERTFHVGNRSVMMLVGAHNLVLRIGDFGSAESLAQRIDSFIKDRVSS